MPVRSVRLARGPNVRDRARPAEAGDDIDALLDYRRREPNAERAHPTDEHLMPLLYALGAAGEGRSVARIGREGMRPITDPREAPGAHHMGIAFNASLYKYLPYDPLRDITPIAYVGCTPNILVATNSFPPKTVDEFLGVARSIRRNQSRHGRHW